jgi:DNA-binding NarL/FixJ family response regulator
MGEKPPLPAKSSFRVLVVEDYEPWRRFILTTLQKQPELQVIGEALDGLEAVQKAEELQPDLIVLDIGLPKLNGLEAARQIRKVSTKSKILFVSQESSAEVVQEALALGALGYVLKTRAGSELLAAVEAVRQGRQFICSGLSRDSKLHLVESNPYLLFAGSPWIPKLLESTIEATAADFGNVQLFDSSRQGLRIVVHHGFGSEFLTYFETVCNGSSPCGEAMNRRSRVIVPDVASDQLFLDHQTRDVMLRAQVRSCQSTPLINSSGKFLGVVSTHFVRPRRFSPRVLKRVDDITVTLVAKITAMPNTLT